MKKSEKFIATIIMGMGVLLAFPNVVRAESIKESESNLETELETESEMLEFLEELTELEMEEVTEPETILATEILTEEEPETTLETELETEELEVPPITVSAEPESEIEQVVSRVRAVSTSTSYTNNVEGFVERLYNICLGRNSDKQGQAYWSNLLKTKKQTAAEVTWNFFNSEEYRLQNHSNDVFVEHLYQVMMNRKSDTSGKNYWLEFLTNGVSRKYVVRGFINSEEFTIICNQYKVTKGSLILTENRDKNYNTTKFVQRMYNTCLNRSGDIGGLNYWTELLNSGAKSGADCMLNFFESPEYKAKNKSDEAYINDLYQALFNRTADNGGRSHWLMQLANGASRRFLLAGFANSTEFTTVCKNFNINRGSVSVTDNDKPKYIGVAFPGATTATVVRVFEKYIGTEYNGNNSSPSPQTGWDCSGFVTWVARNYLQVDMGRDTDDIMKYIHAKGVQNVLNGNTSAQYNTAVANGQVKPGDIIMFYSNGITIHVSIALEDGWIIGALNTRWKTHKQTFTESWEWSGNSIYDRYEVYRGVN
jgi:Cell wall-associated hydrolases (invasion-associated proteins)